MIRKSNGSISLAGLIGLLLVAASLLAACGAMDEPAATPTDILPSPTPTEEPGYPEPLVICLAEEPNTLYPFGELNQAAQQVLAAIYDGPIDYRNYAYQAVILEGVPSLANGDAIVQTVSVQGGDHVVDSDGELVTLEAGVWVNSAGCRSADCAQVYTGGELLMDQLVVTFKLLPDLLWGDGTPLTAYDSVYAFELNGDPATPASHYKVERTDSYQAADAQTVVWTGLPGYLDPDYQANFWLPAPQHLWGEYDADQLPTAALSSQMPLGWGPYNIEQWVNGEQIVLRRNPYYLRTDEGLPYFRSLIFRFVGEDGDANLDELLSGACDLLAPGTGLEDQAERALELAETGEISPAFSANGVWEHLDFSIVPRSHDNGYTPWADRPDFFGDVRVRQAFAQCIDRQALAERYAFGEASVLDTYLPAGHSLANPDVARYAYDPAGGLALLEDIGWRMGAEGVLYAASVEGIVEGTEFALTYYTTEEETHQEIAASIAADLAACGVAVTVETLAPETLYAPGPEGPLFGRQFDLAQFAWPTADAPSCQLYLGTATPGNDLSLHIYGWGGWNLTGWRNAEYDATCEQALAALPGEQDYTRGHSMAQELFAAELPALPLFAYQDMVAARPDFCGLIFDATAGALWNIEAFGYAELCSE